MLRYYFTQAIIIIVSTTDGVQPPSVWRDGDA